MPPKRNRDGSPKGSRPVVVAARRVSPYLSMFEDFRSELDQHHERRERIVKASRDVTALSKKMIFSLQRAKDLGTQLPESIQTENAPRIDSIRSLLTSLVPDLKPGPNTWRYHQQLSPGLQELVEAAAFASYLESLTLLRPDEAARSLVPEGIRLEMEDWLLGVFDTVGEMMRWAITAMALQGQVPQPRQTQDDSFHETTAKTRLETVSGTEDSSIDPAAEQKHHGTEPGEVDAVRPTATGRNMVNDMRELRAALEMLETKGSSLDRDISQKVDVMQTCVNKVENALYSLVVRGQERPKGWKPDTEDHGDAIAA